MLTLQRVFQSFITQPRLRTRLLPYINKARIITTLGKIKMLQYFYSVIIYYHFARFHFGWI